MPIQVWTHPRADLNTMAGGRALAEGVASLGNLGDAIERAMERKKSEAQLATVLRKKHAILQPDRKDEFQTMSLGDLIGEDKGFVAKAIEQDQAQERQVKQAQLAHYLEQQAQAQRAPAFFQRLSESGQDPASVPAPVGNKEFARRTAPLDARSVFEAAAATGYNPGGQTDDLLRAIQQGKTAPDGPMTFDEDPVTGTRFGRLGKSVLPSGTNPNRMGANGVEAVYDPETGQPLGHWISHGGAKPVWKALPPDTGLSRDEMTAMTTEMRPYGDAVFRSINKITDEAAEKKIEAIRKKYVNAAAVRKGRRGGAPAVPDASPAPSTSVPRFRYNPATGKLEPVK